MPAGRLITLAAGTVRFNLYAARRPGTRSCAGSWGSPAPGRAGRIVELQLCRAAGAAGTDGRCADPAHAGARYRRRRRTRAARHRVAVGAGGRLRHDADDAGGARGQRPVRHHGAGRRARGPARARRAHGQGQPRARAPAGAAQPARHRGDARRRAGRGPARPRAGREPSRAPAARPERHVPAGAVPAARRRGLGVAREDGRARVRRGGVAGGRARRGARVRPHRDPHAAGSHPFHAPPRVEGERRVLRAAARGCAQHAGPHAAGKARGDGPGVGRHRTRDPQPAGRHRAGQRVVVGRRDDAVAAPAHAHGHRQRRAPEANRRRCDGGGARHRAGPGRHRCRCASCCSLRRMGTQRQSAAR